MVIDVIEFDGFESCSSFRFSKEEEEKAVYVATSGDFDTDTEEESRRVAIAP
jgi:hypothetical protein